MIGTATFDNVSVTPLPAPWQSLDIGSPGLQGSAEYYNSAYTLKGAGNVSSTADKVPLPVPKASVATGNFIARISTLQNTGTQRAAWSDDPQRADHQLAIRLHGGERLPGNYGESQRRARAPGATPRRQVPAAGLRRTSG